MVSKIRMFGVPTSMGAFAPGQEDAPAALRAAGLAERIRAVGIDVDDLGDLPRRRWTPDAAHPSAQNVQAVAEIPRLVAERVATPFDPDGVLLVLGGDCSVELGVSRATPARPAVPDSSTPTCTPTSTPRTPPTRAPWTGWSSRT